MGNVYGNILRESINQFGGTKTFATAASLTWGTTLAGVALGASNEDHKVAGGIAGGLIGNTVGGAASAAYLISKGIF